MRDFINRINWENEEIKNIIDKNEAQGILEMAEIDPSSCAGKMRTVCERITKFIYEKTEENPEHKDFGEMAFILKEKGFIKEPKYLYINTIRLTGNIGIHEKIENKEDIEVLIPMFIYILNWFLEEILPELTLKNFLYVKDTQFSGFNISKKGFCSKKRDAESFESFTFLSTSQYNPLIKCEENDAELPDNKDNPLETEIAIKLLSHLYDEIKDKGINQLWRDKSKEAINYRKNKQFDEENPLRIGIITFYVLHFHMLFKKISLLNLLEKYNKRSQSLIFKFKDLSVKVEVGVAESFKERLDIIIIPLTRTNTTRTIGILEYKTRVYSTMSLFKHNIFIIGDWDFYKDLKIDKSKTEENNPFMKLCEYCRFNNLVAYLRTDDEEMNTRILELKEEIYPDSQVRELSKEKYKKDLRKRKKKRF